MRSSYEWGTYSEEVLSTYFELVQDLDSWPWQTWEVEGGIWYHHSEDFVLLPRNHYFQDSGPVITNETCRISNDTHSQVINYRDDFFPSFYTSANINTKPVLRHKNYVGGPTVRKLAWNPMQFPNNVSCRVAKRPTFSL